MSTVVIKSKTNFKKTTIWLNKLLKAFNKGIFAKYGEAGVKALSEATPVDTGKTAASWGYNLKTAPGSVTIEYTNSNVNKGVPIALVLQYGHGTGTGGYVQGVDYINPAIRPIFKQMASDLGREVAAL